MMMMLKKNLGGRAKKRKVAGFEEELRTASPHVPVLAFMLEQSSETGGLVILINYDVTFPFYYFDNLTSNKRRSCD